MNLPYSNTIDINRLSRLFDNKSESYKLFWFKAILHEVALGRNEFFFHELIERMIVDAWYMVSEYKLNLGPADTLEKVVLYISEGERIKSTEKEETILSYLKSSEDKQLKSYIRTLSLNVPYRLQAPLMETPDSKLWRRPETITEYINSQEGMMYSIERKGSWDGKVVINPVWIEYLKSNLGILQGWTDYNLITYLQRRNPTVPGISNKIYPPQERKLTAVTNFWKHVVNRKTVADIYTHDILTEKDISIDHFVPWSYVASDELWNLTPTFKSVNSSKSNNLPDWEKYYIPLAKVQYEAYRMLESDETAQKLFDKCAKENLNNEDIKFKLYRRKQSEIEFISQLEEILLPVYESAKNMGFKTWVYEKI